MKSKLTLVIYVRKPKWIATFGDSLIGKIGWDRLEGKGHISPCSATSRKRLLAPECINVFVQLCIDLGTRASIIMTSEMSAAKPIAQI